MAVPGENFYSVAAIIDLFVAAGCKYNIAEDFVESVDGDSFGVAYLINPATDAFVAMVDLAPDEFVSEWEVESWERRLGITIKRPPPLPPKSL